ncbi:MAG: NADH dehydrogenase subunit, partial [Alistipes sp.]|nr:NADH dehydrogenase subunit [Alistipes sp.]
PFNRRNRNSTMDNYPFYTIEGESLHEVNVGPIHAGIIEPGAFRFICNGENVLHLEIALGYQHRGAENEFTSTDNRLRQTLLAEGIAGDSAVSHATAYANTIEKLSGKRASKSLDIERSVALELERMAMHIADTGALSMDVGYQLGQVACEALRTMTINTTQAWCGNRFGKGLIRPCGTNKPLTAEKVEMIRTNVKEIRRRYNEVREDIKSSPTLLARFEECGIVPKAEMQRIGGVGMASRASGVKRDIRSSHPYAAYSSNIAHECVTKRQGDVMSRLMVRSNEVLQSADYIEQLLAEYTPSPLARPDYNVTLAAESLSFSLVEGWRGEICHVAITNIDGAITTYKVKDPSLHNWLALAIAVRGEGISDFPICNKSFNLSYCGHDL